jgi:hypothetical protein
MNELQLINNYYLKVADRLNFAIVEKTINQSGKSIEVNRGYYGTIQSALKSVINIAIKSNSKPLTAKTILQAINDLDKKIDSLEYKHISKLFEEVKNE